MKHLKAYDTEADKTAGQASLYLPSLIKVRNPLAVYGSGNYVKNGLIFQLDGIHKGQTDNAWTDLIGGHVFTNNGCTALENGWQISNTTSTYNSLRNTDTLPFGSNSYSTHTIECVYYTPDTRGMIVFVPKTENTIIFAYASNRYYLRSKTSDYLYGATSISTQGTHIVSLNINGGLRDNNLALNRLTNTDYFSNGTYNGIGARSNNASYSFNGTIYAIRVYNRLLTVDEMRHNQKEDKKRFGLSI